MRLLSHCQCHTARIALRAPVAGLVVMLADEPNSPWRLVVGLGLVVMSFAS